MIVFVNASGYIDTSEAETYCSGRHQAGGKGIAS